MALSSQTRINTGFFTLFNGQKIILTNHLTTCFRPKITPFSPPVDHPKLTNRLQVRPRSQFYRFERFLSIVQTQFRSKSFPKPKIKIPTLQKFHTDFLTTYDAKTAHSPPQTRIPPCLIPHQPCGHRFETPNVRFVYSLIMFVFYDIILLR